MINAAKPEPMSEKNDGDFIVEKVKKDLDDRAALGMSKYGTKLQAFNGRSALMDAYQEVLDLSQYLCQGIEEWSKMKLAYAILKRAWDNLGNIDEDDQELMRQMFED